MRKVTNLQFRTFAAILTAFNAPFLSVFAALEPAVYDAEWRFLKTVEIIDSCNNHREIPIGSNCQDMVNYPCPFIKTTETSWEFSWQTRSSNFYRFGQDDTRSANTYFVEYDEEGTMASIIEYLVNGTEIPYYAYQKYPYADNPYIIAQKPSDEVLLERKTAVEQEYLASLSEEERNWAEYQKSIRK